MMFKFKKKKAKGCDDPYQSELMEIVEDHRKAIEALQESINTLQRLAGEGS